MVWIYAQQLPSRQLCLLWAKLCLFFCSSWHLVNVVHSQGIILGLTSKPIRQQLRSGATRCQKFVNHSTLVLIPRTKNSSYRSTSLFFSSNSAHFLSSNKAFLCSRSLSLRCCFTRLLSMRIFKAFRQSTIKDLWKDRSCLIGQDYVNSNLRVTQRVICRSEKFRQALAFFL